MTMWLHIIGVIAIVIYSMSRFFKEKRAFHVIISIWAASTLLSYVVKSGIVLWVLGVAQLVMFFVVVFLMFRRRGERRMRTLDLLAKIASEGIPDAPPANSDKPEEIVVEAEEIKDK